MMKLVKLTLTGMSKTPIYMNPDHIISVIRFDKHTTILTTSVGKEGEPKKYNVVERPDVVAAMIDAQWDAAPSGYLPADEEVV